MKDFAFLIKKHSHSLCPYTDMPVRCILLMCFQFMHL